MLYSRLVPLYCNFRDNLQYSIYATRGGCTTKYCISRGWGHSIDVSWRKTLTLRCGPLSISPQNCTSGDTCLRFVCEAKGLERDWSAVVKVMSRLWVQTFLEVRKRERERLIWELIAYHSDIFSTQYFTIATIIGRKEKCSKTALHQIEIAFCRILLL